MTNNQDKRKKYISWAKETIVTEIEGLKSLQSFFEEKHFADAIELILETKGRVIVSGMGKSGHIGNKIAATLASTGTSSFFVHPGEASHGDLGMITKEDVVILLSNSGETKELQDIIYYCKRFNIPLIGIARNPKSELIEASTIPMALPNIKEANDVNAPTTSTTMMIALGDAIAVALMKAKSFSNKDYGIFHPGGKLGSKFLKVKALMRQKNEVPVIKKHKLLPNILFEMTSKHLGCVGVVNESSNLIGIITDGDIRRNISQNITKINAEKLMSKNPIVIEENTLAVEAVALMNEKKITNLFVVKDKNDVNNLEIIGILHIHDCLRAKIF
ncbi:KpsF/GutQ family sugar-phosphate isomerase [Rickettsiales bacterium]|nr:KpsF/GutQ family sugar-phosphate isomerase [Rickettsiales bacterium]